MRVCNFYWILIFLTLNLAINATSDTLIIENIISEGGSQYEYYTESNNYNISSGFTVQTDQDFEILVGINVISFASSVNDFHDIFLYIRLVNNEGLLIENVARVDNLNAASMGVDFIFQFDRALFQYIDTNSSVTYYTNFNIYVGSTFREDVSLATDPSTDDRWHFLHEADITTLVTDQVDIITSQPEIIKGNELNNTISEDPSTTTPPDYYVLPTVTLLIPLLMLVGAGFYIFRRRSKTEIISSNSIAQKKNELSDSEVSKSKLSQVSAKLCPNCGTLNADVSDFCMECGIHLS